MTSRVTWALFRRLEQGLGRAALVFCRGAWCPDSRLEFDLARGFRLEFGAVWDYSSGWDRPRGLRSA